MTAIWSFLLDVHNREVLAWVGGGFVVLAGAVWKIVEYVNKKSPTDNTSSNAGVSGKENSVVAGRDISNSRIKIETNERKK